MSFLQRRFFSTSTLKSRNANHYIAAIPSLGAPSPPELGPRLATPELKQLAEKAKGAWKDLSKQETVQLYRATFPFTFKEMRSSRGHYRIVIPAVTGFLVAGYFLAAFLRTTIGPEQPHTFENPEWEEATRAIMLKNKANPITGISSKQAQKA